MKRLSNIRGTAAARAVGIIDRLSELDSVETLEKRFIEVAGQIVPGDCLCWNNWESDWSGPISIRMNDPIYEERLNEMFGEFSELVGLHPVLAGGCFMDSAHTVFKLSEMPGAARFRRNPLYEHIYKHLDSRFQLAHAPALLFNRRIVLTWNRRGCDFNDAERDLFYLIGDRLRQVALKIEERARIEAIWTALCEFVGQQSPALCVESLGLNQLRLITQAACGNSITAIARAKCVRQDTVAKQFGEIREILGLENHRQLLSILADLRVLDGNGRQ